MQLHSNIVTCKCKHVKLKFKTKTHIQESNVGPDFIIYVRLLYLFVHRPN